MANSEPQTDGAGGASERTPLLQCIDEEESPPEEDEIEETVQRPDPEQQGITKAKLFVVCCILLTELCERMTFYSVTANMVLFCQSELKYSSYSATLVYNVYTGVVSLFPVLGGYVSDALAGKFRTILAAGLIYLIGLLLLPASAIDYPKWFKSTHDLNVKDRSILFFLGLTLIAIGTGGIKANVGPFGAQQVKDLGEKAVQSFFNWFYWFINVGSIIAFSAVAYVQQEHGFDVGFLIPFFSMLVAIIIFVLAKNRYLRVPPGGSILSKSFKVCCNACHGCKDPSWDHALNKGYTDEFVFGVKATLHIIPILILLIVYWATYIQMGSSLYLQTERMNLYVGKAKMPAAFLSVFDTIIILILIPIMEKIVYPCLDRFGKRPTPLQRMGIGMILAACSMLYAGMIEMVRKSDIEKHGSFLQELDGKYFNASKISMFAQVPEFVFIGASEVFTSITGLEFAFTQAPQFMQGLLMGLFLMTSGIGGFLGTAIVAILHSWRTSDASDWYPKEPNNGHLEYFLFLMAVLVVVNLLVFIVVAKRYKYVNRGIEEITIRPEREDEENDTGDGSVFEEHTVQRYDENYSSSRNDNETDHDEENGNGNGSFVEEHTIELHDENHSSSRNDKETDSHNYDTGSDYADESDDDEEENDDDNKDTTKVDIEFSVRD